MSDKNRQEFEKQCQDTGSSPAFFDAVSREMSKPEVQQRLQAALNLPDEAFGSHASDLYVLALPGVGEWLKANYEWWSNVTTFVGNPGHPVFGGKLAYDIPFANSEWWARRQRR